MRNEGGGFAEIDDEVAAVLAFVISHTTFLAAQDDETGRCPKVVCKSLVISNPCGLTYVGANPASLRSAAPSRGRGERMRLSDVRLRLWKAEVRSQKSKVYSNGSITVWKYAFSSLGVACILFLRTHHWTISTKLPEM